MYSLSSPLIDWIITSDDPGNLPETLPRLVSRRSCVWPAKLAGPELCCRVFISLYTTGQQQLHHHHQHHTRQPNPVCNLGLLCTFPSDLSVIVQFSDLPVFILSVGFSLSYFYDLDLYLNIFLVYQILHFRYQKIETQNNDQMELTDSTEDLKKVEGVGEQVRDMQR